MKTKLSLIAGCMAVALALAGCGNAVEAADEHSHETETHEHEHDLEAPEGAEETFEASPRIVVSTESGVTVLDEDLKPITSFETQMRPSLSMMHDNRHIALVQGSANKVQVVDSGSWAVGHGDHFHFYTGEPKLLEAAAQGSKPVHVVANPEAGKTTAFFDGDGKAALFDDEVLEDADLSDLTFIDAKGPEHGVVAPLADGTRMVTQPGNGEGVLPDSVEWQDENGNVKETYECSLLHGEVAVGNKAGFGCADSVLIIEDGKETRVANPENSKDRIGAIRTTPDGETFFADWTDTKLMFITDGKATVTDVGVAYGNLTAIPNGQFAVLGVDGIARVYDADGKEAFKKQVTDPWTPPEGHAGEVPYIAGGELAAAPMLWITDPNAGKVYALDLFSDTLTSADVEGKPAQIQVGNSISH